MTTTPSWTANTTISGNFVDAKFSADGSLLYAVSGNTVSVINVATGAVVNHYTVGTTLGAFDLSADGRYLAVVENSASESVYRIDLTSGAVTTYSETSATNNHLFDIAFLADGTALVSQNGSGNVSASLQQLDFSTGSFTNVTSSPANLGSATLTASSDHSHVMVEAFSYQLPSYVYVAGAGIAAQALGDLDPYAGAAMPPPPSGVEAISPDGTVYVQGQTLNVYDAALNLKSSIAAQYPYLGNPSGLAFSPDGHELYIVSGTDVVVVDASSWTATGVYSLTANSASSTNGDTVQASPDGHTLSIIGASGIQLIDLSQSQLVSTNGNDTLSGNGLLLGLGGNDDLTGTASGSWMYGGPGDDTYHVTSSNDWVFEYPNQGHDTVYSTIDYTLPANVEDLYLQGNAIHGSGNELDNLIVGDDQDNILSGGAGNDHLEGGAGNDTLDGGPGDDILDGGTGVNTASYQSATSGVTVSLGVSGPQNTVGAGNDTLINIQNLTGSQFADHLTGDSNANVITGGGGADILTGGLGADTLVGGTDGNVTFKDTAAGLNTDTIVNFVSSDKIIITDADLQNFAFSLSGNVLTFTGGSLTFSTPVGFRLQASAAPGGGVQVSMFQPTLATNDQIATQLTSGYWAGDAHHWNVTQGGTLTVDIHTLTAPEQTLALAALQEWTDIIGVNFQQVTSGAQIVFDDGGDPNNTTPVAQTSANWANGTISSASIEISKSWVNKYGTGLDTYSFQTYIHEIGHALGLGHPGPYNETATYPADVNFTNDAWSTSVMSYFSQTDNTYFQHLSFSDLYVLTPMPADILAMQQLYGLSTTTRTGDTIYGDHSNAGGIYNAAYYPAAAYTIFDGGGNDTIDYSLSPANQLINLNPETYSNVNGYTGNLTIARGVVIENAIGGSGNDTLIGNSLNNVLTGNAGTDMLTGGGGSDTFLDTKANHSGDIITDFHGGDSIVFSDANLGSFSYSFSGNTLNYTGGSMTVDGSLDGKFVLAAVTGGGLALEERAIANSDFSGSGHSDVLLVNDNGSVTDWLGQFGGSFFSNQAAASYSLPSGWSVAGTGDFNGDGHVDLLLRNTSGTITEWLGQTNGGFAWNSAATYALDNSWHVAATGDFNGDGRSDVLLVNSNGSVTDWLGQPDGTFFSNHVAASYALPSGWSVVGSGDFNDDGRSDLLLRNTNGTITEWLGTSSGGFTWNSNATYSLDPSWHVAGTGDFNGDGNADVLLVNNNGSVTDWLGQSDGTFFSNYAAASYALPSGWSVAGTGDYNSDGISDVLLRNTNGTITEWLGQSSGGFSWNANATYALDNSWHVQPQETMI